MTHRNGPVSPPNDARDGVTEQDRRLVTDGGEVRDPSPDEAALTVDSSTEEIASMLDDAVDQAGTVSDEVEAVAAANKEQAGEGQEINEVIGRLRPE